MKILRTYESWIHTHFVTDGQQLPSPRVREIEQGVMPLLRRLGIVFGVHLERERSDPGIRVVLECRPSAAELTQIWSRLDDILAPSRAVLRSPWRTPANRRPRRRVVRRLGDRFPARPVASFDRSNVAGRRT